MNDVKNAISTEAKLAPRSLAWIFGSSVGPRIYLEPETGASSGDDGGEGNEGGAGEGEKKTEEHKTEEGGAGGEEKKISDKEAELLKEVMKKKDENKTLKDRLAKFDGIDPDDVRKMLEERAENERKTREAEQKTAEERGDFERVKTMMAEEHKRELDAEKEKTKKNKDDLTEANRVINELTVGAAFSASSFIGSDLVLTPAKTRQIFGHHFELEDGAVVAYDKPRGKSERTKLVDGQGHALGFEEALRRLVDADPDRDSLMKSKLAAGAGSKTTEEKPNTQTEARGAGRILAALEALKKKS